MRWIITKINCWLVVRQYWMQHIYAVRHVVVQAFLRMFDKWWMFLQKDTYLFIGGCLHKMILACTCSLTLLCFLSCLLCSILLPVFYCPFLFNWIHTWRQNSHWCGLRYSILSMTGVLTLMSFAVTGTRALSEGFMSIWSALMLLSLSIGGTMIMRKFHNSMAVGFFMGGVVAMAQLFFFLSMM